MPKVYNRYHRNEPDDAVYIGRPSEWGNPFRVGSADAATRQEAVRKYEKYLELNPDVVEHVKRHLRNKDLVCFCAPLPCHGDVLLRIANEEN